MWNYNNSNHNQSLHSILNVAWINEVEKYFVYKIAVKNAAFWEHKSIPGGWYGPGVVASMMVVGRWERVCIFYFLLLIRK